MIRRTTVLVGWLVLLVAGCGPDHSGGESPAKAALMLGPRGPLQIEMQRPDGTGTMHYAERTSIRLGDMKPIVMTTDVGADRLAPILQAQLQLNDSRFLVLGWTSWGGGMQTNHAYLVGREGDTLRVVDRLEVRTGRGSAGLIVENGSDGTRIGMFEPPVEAHESGEWWVSIGGRRLDMDQIRHLTYVESPASGRATAFYDPPFFSGRARGRVAWVVVRDGRFQLE